ncbi:MAG: hypothetical protein JXR46_16820 [Calditrichaceae bacterium]|nr:hypothetical protein [Calditrichaceae bacterium]MBN2710711.1 hypothetical protein [Calditrichaceae bacterium]RQV92740.1 MAG: hypothetical protein EH224_14505 [Calditrichota bacterium]
MYTFNFFIFNSIGKILLALSISYFILVIPSCIISPDEPIDGNGNWISIGLEGKLITNIKTTKNYIYACAAFDGLFRHPISSLNNDWEYIGLEHHTLINGISIDTLKGVSSPNTVGMSDVIINPNNENEMIAVIITLGPNVPGIYKTVDGGENWIEADSGYGFIPYWWPDDSGRFNPWKSAQVLFNPTHQFDVIFAGDVWNDGIYRSTNSGLTWEAVIKPNLNTFSQTNSFSQDPYDPTIIYAGGSGSAGDAPTWRPAWFIKSTNGVEGIWETLLPDGTEYVYFDSVVDDICFTTNPQAIYLGMRTFILGSRDDGKTWTKLFTDSDHPANIFSIEASPNNERHLAAGNGQILIESTDAGKTWAKVKTPANGRVGGLRWDKQTDNLYVISGDSSGIYVLPEASSIRLTNTE